MKIITLLFMIAALYGCNSDYYETKPMQLRQLVQTTETHSGTSASMFFLVGTYHKDEKTETTVRMFVKCGDGYALLEVDITKVIIVIDNNLSIPFVAIKGRWYDNRPGSDCEAVMNYNYSKVAIIHCAEKYLPEKLIPIGL